MATMMIETRRIEMETETTTEMEGKTEMETKTTTEMETTIEMTTTETEAEARMTAIEDMIEAGGMQMTVNTKKEKSFITLQDTFPNKKNITPNENRNPIICLLNEPFANY